MSLLFYFKSLIVNYLSSKKQLSNLRTIFITSPISIAEHLRSNATYLPGYKVFTSLDTESFLKQEAEDCGIIRRFFGDVLSTLEKDIQTLFVQTLRVSEKRYEKRSRLEIDG